VVQAATAAELEVYWINGWLYSIELIPLLAVSVYIVVTDGRATVLLPLVVDNPAAGDHEYASALPVAAMVVVLPHAIVTSALALTTGYVYTATVLVAVIAPATVDAVTVYVVVTVGEAITTVPVVVLRPVAGDHEYAVPPPAVAVSVADEPTQIEGAEVAIATGPPTATVTVELFWQPLEPPA
jgi:small-conductance mechanosensitive channel